MTSIVLTFDNGNTYTWPDDFIGDEGYEYVESLGLLFQDIITLQVSINADSSIINKRAALAQTASAAVLAGENRIRRLLSNARQAAADAQAAVGGVKVSANDTAAGNLNGKLVAADGIILTETNDGGDESLTVSTNRRHIAMIAQSFG